VAEYKLTTKSQEAILDARHRAATAGHPYVEPIHLLLALLAQVDGTARPLLAAVGASPDALQTQAQAMLDRSGAQLFLMKWSTYVNGQGDPAAPGNPVLHTSAELQNVVTA